LPVRAAVLKGRGRYVCLHRVQEAVQRGPRPGALAQHARLRELLEWAQRSREGDLDELPTLADDPALRAVVVSTSESCLRQACPRWSDCHVERARRRAGEADVVVINHALWLGELRAKRQGRSAGVPGASAVVFDEAHALRDQVQQWHTTRAEAPALAPQVAQLQQRFDAAHQERKAAMLALAAREDRPSQSLAATTRYQRAVEEVALVRLEARKLVGGKTDADGVAKDDKDTNNIFCRYILDQLPPVLLGLIIAAIFAAAMSSIDSVLNALSGATVVDVYRRWLRPDATDAQSLRVGRYVTLFWGVVATFTALFFAGGGSIIEMINRVGSWFYGSLLGIFVMALFFRRAGDLAGALGLCGGMAAVVLVHNTVKVQFLWYNVVGLAGVLLVGGLVAALRPRR